MDEYNFNKASNDDAIDSFFNHLTRPVEPTPDYAVFKCRAKKENPPKPNEPRPESGIDYVDRFKQDLSNDLAKVKLNNENTLL